jgi:hypothetical protein
MPAQLVLLRRRRRPLPPRCAVLGGIVSLTQAGGAPHEPGARLGSLAEMDLRLDRARGDRRRSLVAAKVPAGPFAPPGFGGGSSPDLSLASADLQHGVMARGLPRSCAPRREHPRRRGAGAGRPGSAGALATRASTRASSSTASAWDPAEASSARCRDGDGEGRSDDLRGLVSRHARSSAGRREIRCPGGRRAPAARRPVTVPPTRFQGRAARVEAHGTRSPTSASTPVNGRVAVAAPLLSGWWRIPPVEGRSTAR